MLFEKLFSQKLMRSQAVQAQKQFGERCEGMSAQYLGVSLGWDLLEQNLRVGRHEFDLLMRSEAGLHFVEVKGRRGRRYGDVVESLTPKKLLHLKRGIAKWASGSRTREPLHLRFMGWTLVGGRWELDEHELF